MNLGIDGDTALVTASSRGLGKASALSLSKEGVNVVINARNQERLDETAAELAEEGNGEVRAVRGDLTDPDDIRSLVRTTVDEFGGLDHLVFNTGGPPTGTFLETTDEEWYHAYDLLVMSLVRLARASEEYLRTDDGGSIVTISSWGVKEAIDNLVLSNAVRMGVIGLQKTLSREFAPEIRVNGVLPGSYRTERGESIREQVDEDEYESFVGIVEDLLDVTIPLERSGEPMELGETVAFLCSERSSYINGVALAVDGGLLRSNM